MHTITFIHFYSTLINERPLCMPTQQTVLGIAKLRVFWPEFTPNVLPTTMVGIFKGWRHTQ